MAKIKKRKQDLSRDEAHIKPPELSDAAWEIIREIEENGRWKQFDKMASFHDGKLHLPGTVFLAKMHALSTLARPDNPSHYMIEYVKVGKTIFLHLVEKPPREVLEAMARDGLGNYSSSNDISRLLEELGDSAVTDRGGISRISSVSHHPKNPYKRGKGYIHLVDILAAAGPGGIDEESWIQSYLAITGKDREHAGYDLDVIKSAMRGRRRHSSCQPGFTVIEHGGRYSIRFD